MRKWFDIRASGADGADVHIYDEIGGWGINAKQFQQELEEKQAKRLNVYINSPGGDVFNGIAIQWQLRYAQISASHYYSGIFNPLQTAGVLRCFASFSHQ